MTRRRSQTWVAGGVADPLATQHHRPAPLIVGFPESGHLIGSSLTFYLGTHQPQWLSRTTARLFVSHRRLRDRKTLPKKLDGGGYAVDSGGFTELSMFGTWTVTPEEYVAAVARYDSEIGWMDWAAPQDWMCEPFITAKTGLTVAEHQRRTVENFARLTELWPEYSDDECPFMPVLQGWTLDDYLTCWRMYEDAGIDPRNFETVGLGSVCRRQATSEIAQIVTTLRQLDPGLPLHGFGVKLDGLRRYGHLLASADSMAWSFHARRLPPLPGCTTHINCANCMRFALDWRDRVLNITEAPRQLDLLMEGVA